MLNNPYINAAPKITYIVVNISHDETLADEGTLAHSLGPAIDLLKREEAVSEVRHALNVWYYEEAPHMCDGCGKRFTLHRECVVCAQG